MDTEQMIISHQYKFIFLKTHKTAGTSTEIALSRFCGDDDIITPITPDDEELRHQLGYRGPQNYYDSLTKYQWSDWKLFLRTGKRRARFYNHISANEIRDRVNTKIWNSYFKFCFERNPWDKVLSYYYWRNRKKQCPAMNEFISSGSFRRASDFDLYTIDGEIAMDFIGRYEKLEDDLDYIQTQINLPEKLQLVKAKAGHRKNREHYKDILSQDEIDMISNVFYKEIEYFGYLL